MSVAVEDRARAASAGIGGTAVALSALLAGTLGGPDPAASWKGLKQELRNAAAKDPLDALVVVVLGGSFLFWLAERDDNPKCRTYFDALVFVSTALSVGYADVFARTKTGQAIAAALMTVGPALAARALDPPTASPGEAEQTSALPAEVLAVQSAILDKLDAILVELRRA